MSNNPPSNNPQSNNSKSNNSTSQLNSSETNNILADIIRKTGVINEDVIQSLVTKIKPEDIAALSKTRTISGESNKSIISVKSDASQKSDNVKPTSSPKPTQKPPSDVYVDRGVPFIFPKIG